MTREEAIALGTKLREEGMRPTDIAKKVTEAGYVSKITGQPIGPVWVSHYCRPNKGRNAEGKRKYTKRADLGGAVAPKMITIPVHEEQVQPKQIICLIGDAGQITLAIKEMMK